MGTGKLRIGTSGWSYKHWRGTFYPPGLPVKDQFAHYRSIFDTVELNAPFYRLPSKETFGNWHAAVDDGFLFSVKASRFITHMKKLSDPARSTALFFENVSGLQNGLGPILFQLPPKWNLNKPRLEEFLANLPKDLMYTFEFRNPTWYDDEVFELLRKYKCAFCIYDLAGHQSPIKVTADFAYIRLHGPEKYAGSYYDEILIQWANRCAGWLRSQIDVYIYFDNDIGTAAPHDAQRLRDIVAKIM